LKITDKKPRVLSRLKVEVTSQELLERIKTSNNVQEISKTAEKTLYRTKGIWQPGAVLRWLEIKNIEATRAGVIIPETKGLLNFYLGFSIKFLKHAKHVLLAVYTAGKGLENESMKASSKGDFLEVYLIDLIGLIVLDKAGQTVKEIAEKQAAKLGWGVSPFLSPGSVHGWELEEQIKLCSLLPIKKLNVKIGKDAVLSPFKTLSCLIALGPGYDAVQVGETCHVCSKKDECQMKRI